MHKTFDEITHAHFIGIGGIGLSAIARMFLLRGVKVSGSDISTSRVTEELQKLGATITFDQTVSALGEDVDLVLYTIAIPDSNPELLGAKSRGIVTLTYPEALGLISKTHTTVAISGTHGKTTTTAMTAEALIAAGLNPTVIVGSFLKSSGSNFIPGKSNLFVVEACEYRESFSHLEPYILAITNIEAEHLDYYKDISDVVRAFREVASKVPEGGAIVTNPNDPIIASALVGTRAQIVDYTESLGDAKLSIPGAHNQSNAAVALSIARLLGANEDKVRSALEQFSGTWRRFEKKGKLERGALVYDDYAHHPTEIRATLQGAREAFPEKYIVAIFQPHLFSRTKLLLNGFARAFGDADEVIVLPIYKAREEGDGTISSETLVQELQKYHKNSYYIETFEEAQARVNLLMKKHTSESVFVITLGAGNVYTLGERLVDRASEK